MVRNLHKTIVNVLLFSGLGGVGNAAAENWYVRADAGHSVQSEINFDTGVNYDLDDEWMAALGGGYAFTNGLRLEGELAYRTNGQSGGAFDVEATSLMANLYYDFNRAGRFKPYVGFGAGGVSLEMNDLPPSVEIDDGLAWQAMAGVAIGLTDSLDLDVGYRLLSAEELDFEEPGITSGETDYEHQAVTVGVRYQR